MHTATITPVHAHAKETVEHDHTYILTATTTNIKHQTSNIKHQTSNIKHQTSNIKHQTSNIKHQTSNIKHQTSNIKHQTSNIKHHKVQRKDEKKMLQERCIRSRIQALPAHRSPVNRYCS
jgi:septal ring factor EnvC (AmiA/AmiB activator)